MFNLHILLTVYGTFYLLWHTNLLHLADFLYIMVGGFPLFICMILLSVFLGPKWQTWVCNFMWWDTLYYKGIIYLMGLIPLWIPYNICFDMEHSLSKALQDPSSSPWHHRFEFWHLALLIQHFSMSTFSDISPPAWRIIRRLKEHYKAPSHIF